jgi:DNA-binding NtrC family response regulator
MEASAMPAPVLVVHNEFDTRELALTALRATGREAAGFENPMTALDAIEADSRVRVLVTGVDFGDGKLNGVAFALMAKVKRPGLQAVFVASLEDHPYTEGVGDVLPTPLDPQALVDVVGRCWSIISSGLSDVPMSLRLLPASFHGKRGIACGEVGIVLLRHLFCTTPF